MSSKFIQPSESSSLTRESLSSLRMIQQFSVPVTVTLYGTDTCLNTTAIKVLLSYKRVPFVLTPPPEEGVSPSFKALVPNAKTPALVHNDFVVTESSVIMEYLEENFCDLAPPLLVHRHSHKNANTRYACRVHDFFIEPAVRLCLSHIDIVKRDRAVVDHNIEIIMENLAEIERVCDSHGPFFCGDQMTFADCVLPGTLLLLEMLMVEYFGHGVDYINKFPKLGSVRGTHLNHFSITSVLLSTKDAFTELIGQLKLRAKPSTPRSPRALSVKINSLPKIV